MTLPSFAPPPPFEKLVTPLLMANWVDLCNYGDLRKSSSSYTLCFFAGNRELIGILQVMAVCEKNVQMLQKKIFFFFLPCEFSHKIETYI